MSGRLEREIEQNLSLEKISSSSTWLRNLKPEQFQPEMIGNSLKVMSATEMRYRTEAENSAKSKLGEIIESKLDGNLNVTVDLKLEGLHVFKKGNVYVICKDLSVAKKNLLGTGVIEQVTFTDVNGILECV